MKKTIFGLMVLVLISAASCKKNPTAGGSWTFRGMTYDVTTCGAIGNTVAASSSTNANITYYGGLTVFFPGPVPSAGGTYTVVDTTPVGNQVNVVATVGGAMDTAYNATGGNGSNQTILVTVSNGRVTVSGTGIEMLNSLVPTDSSAVSFNVYTAGN